MADINPTPDPCGAKPYESYLPGEHPQDTRELQESLQDPVYLRKVLQEKVEELAAGLDDDDELQRVYKRALGPGGTAWEGAPFDLLVKAVSEVIAPVVERLNCVIDTLDYLHLGQPGYIPSSDPDPDPDFEYSAWSSPAYPSSLADEDQNPIEKL